MPGFQISGSETKENNVGGPSHKVETRRKHRWVFSLIQSPGFLMKSEVLVVLKSAQRPSFKFEEAVMDHNQEKAYFAGKQTWEPIKLTWYDAENSPDVSKEIWDWLQSVNEIDTVCVKSPGEPGPADSGPGYKGDAELHSIGGCGVSNETWSMYGVWPTEINWQDLDYTNNEIQLVEATMRYDRAFRRNDQ
jgi:hypothetical protein